MDFLICTRCTWKSPLFQGHIVPSTIRQQAIGHVLDGNCSARIMDLRRTNSYVPAPHLDNAECETSSLEVSAT